MTKIPSILGPAHDAPVKPLASLDANGHKRALVLHRLNAAIEEGDTEIERLMYWELGLLDLVPTPAPTFSIFRGSEYGPYAKHYRFTDDTAAYAKERAVESQDVLHKLRYVEFVLQVAGGTAEEEKTLRRELVRLYTVFSTACMAKPTPLVGCDIDRALRRIAELQGLKGTMRPGEAESHAAWLLKMARDSREIPTEKPEDREQQRPRWIARFLDRLTALPAKSQSPQVREKALSLLHEARDFYALEPLNHEFEIGVLDVELRLLKHWKDTGSRIALLRRQAASIDRRAAFHEATGGQLPALGFFREAARFRHEHPDAFEPEERSQSRIEEQRSVERLSQSDELHHVSIPFEFPHEIMDRSQETPALTVEELLAMSRSMSTKAEVREWAERVARETPLLSQIGRQIISNGKVVGETDGPEKNIELDMEAHMVMVARVLGASFMITIRSAAERTGLAADDLMSPLLCLPVDPNTLALLRHGIQRALDGDWIASLHILALQCEPVLRQVLKANGFSTTKFVSDVGDGTSRTDDLAIGSLLDSKRARSDGVTSRQFLGEDLAWRINGVLSSQTGPNLRNAVAHGEFPASAMGKQEVGMVMLLLYGLTSRIADPDGNGAKERKGTHEG